MNQLYRDQGCHSHGELFYEKINSMPDIWKAKKNVHLLKLFLSVMLNGNQRKNDNSSSHYTHENSISFFILNISIFVFILLHRSFILYVEKKRHNDANMTENKSGRMNFRTQKNNAKKSYKEGKKRSFICLWNKSMKGEL